MGRIDGHDVRVLELGKSPGLVEKLRRDLEGDRAVSQITLPRQVNPTERSTTQLPDQTKPSEVGPGLREPLQGIGYLVGRTRIGGSERACPGRSTSPQTRRVVCRFRCRRREPAHLSDAESPAVLVRRGAVPNLPPQPAFLEGGQAEQRGVVPEGRKACEVVLQGDRLSPSPAVLQVDPNQLAKHGSKERMVGLGQESGEVGVAVSYLGLLESVDERVDALRLESDPRLRPCQSPSRIWESSLRRNSWSTRSTVRCDRRDLLGDLGHLVTLDPPLDDWPMAGREGVENLLDYQPEDGHRPLVPALLGVERVLVGRAPGRLSDVAPGCAVVIPSIADLVQRDDQQELPYLLPLRHVVLPLGGAAKEGAEDRLDNVIGSNPGPHSRRELGRSQRADSLGVPQEELGRTAVLPLAKPLQQRVIRTCFVIHHSSLCA